MCPNVHAIAFGPIPAGEQAVDGSVAPTLRAAADHNGGFTDLVGLGVERGESRKSFRHLPEIEVAVRIGEPTHNAVI